MIVIKYYKIKQGSTIVGVKFSYSETRPDTPEKKFHKSYFFQGQSQTKEDAFTEVDVDTFKYLCGKFNVLIRLEDTPPHRAATS